MKMIGWTSVSMLTLFVLAGCESQLVDSSGLEQSSGVADAAVRLADADNGGLGLHATMTGDQEAPGPGDPDGSGTAVFTLNPGQRTVCFELTVSDIDPAAAAHIHIAPPGQPGPVVVPLVAPTDGSSSGCVENVDRELILDIIQDPGAYYVNVHNPAYPPGAVRGQLER